MSPYITESNISLRKKPENKRATTNDLSITCSSPATMNMASTGMTAPFIVIDTLILSSGIPSNN